MDDGRERHHPSGDAQRRSGRPNAWFSTVGEPPGGAEDDGAPLSGGEGDRDPPGHRRRRDSGSNRLRKFLGHGRPGRRHRGRPDLHRCLNSARQEEDPSGRDDPPRVRIRFRGSREILQRVWSPRCADRRSRMGGVEASRAG